MMVKNYFIMSLLLLFTMGTTMAQEKKISGTVSDEAGMPLPGVNIVVKGTTNGTQTDFDGNYTINAKVGDVLSYTYLGLKTVEQTVGSSNTINVSMQEDAALLEEVVVTALGIKREEKSLTYATQELKSEDLNITENSDIKGALAGKVAGVQINGQVGSKLGNAGKIRIRGGLSLTKDNDALYIVDGVPVVDPNAIDMSNVANVSTLKGPTATALYGQRAASGVVVITTKRGTQNDKIGIEITSSVIFDEVIDNMKFQNLYGQGYDGDDEFGIFDYAAGYNMAVFGLVGGPGSYPSYMQVFDGKRYFNGNVYGDESWGPKFDGEPYVPWYAYYPDSPYFGQTAPWVAQPNNIKDFYNTGYTYKNIISLSGGGDNFTSRFSYTNLDQEGIIPQSGLKKDFFNASFDYNLTENFKIGVTANYSVEKIDGDFSDGYSSNQTSSSFSQWFGRNVDTRKLRELKNLTTPEGSGTNWNNWGLDAIAAKYDLGHLSTAINQLDRPAFWYNPYQWLDHYEFTTKNTTLVGEVHASYKFLDHFEASAQFSRNHEAHRRDWFIPLTLEATAAPNLYNSFVNSFGRFFRTQSEDNYNALLRYNQTFGDIDVSALVGGNIRANHFYSFRNDMSQTNADSGGLILPDVYTYNNSRESLTATYIERNKQVNSIYANLNLGYKSMIYLDASVRKDWSSALPSNNNGYLYPSIGTSFIFTELLDNKDVLSFGKIRASWAQVGDDVGANAINPVYGIGGDLYGDKILQYDRSRLIDPNIKPALNTALEFGVDLKFLSNRLKFSGTYYKENRKDEIIPVTISTGSGYTDYLTNAGETQRKGVELTLDADIFKKEDFSWNMALNWAKNETSIISLPGGLDAVDGFGGSDNWGFVQVTHALGKGWGQLKGRGIQRDADGTPIIQSSGLYASESDVYFGSILPDFTGGIINTFTYKDLSLTASIDFQKGGKFFSLSDMWGASSGLTAQTAAINDKGNNVRDEVADGGGVHVTGVDASGNPVDMYVDAHNYYTQFQPNSIADPFIHDASYIKLRDVSLTYRVPKKLVNNIFDSASISVIGRNLWLISVSDDNVNKWDPSTMSRTYGENASLPNTRSYGLNIKLTF